MYSELLDRITSLEEKVQNKRVLVFGTGKGGRVVNRISDFLGFQIDYYLDNNLSVQDQLFCGRYAVKAPSNLKLEDKSSIVIFVASETYYSEIAIQLKQMDFIEGEHFFSLFMQSKNINISIGKYTYGYSSRFDPSSIVTRIGAFCSINETAQVLVNHPVDLLTTHPFAYTSKQEIEEIMENNYDINVFANDLPRLSLNGSIVKRVPKINGAVTIGNDVWIGANVVILPSINIGNGAILAAGAIVTRDVPDYAIVGGVPAKVLRFRFSQDEINSLNEIQWWNWSDEKILENRRYFIDSENIKAFFELHK